jgi:transcriptional regulator with XRE-family HTH domain
MSADHAAMAQSGFGERFPARNSAVSKALAANVRRIRKERGWTQDDLAAETEVEQAAISRIENARANPTLEMLESLARALDVPFVELFAVQARQRRPKER